MIIMYTKTGCPWCDEVRDFLNKENILFEEREVLSSEKYFEELQEKSKQTKTPTFDISGEIFVDLGLGEAEKILKDKNLI